MFVTITLSPAVDLTLTVAGRLRLGGVHGVTAHTRTAGGKGINVAKVLAGAGCRVCAGGLLGRDQAAFYRDALRRAGVQADFLVVPHPTRTNLMLSDGSRRELKVNWPGFPALEFDWPRLRAYCLRLAGAAPVVLLSGSLPAQFPADTYARLVTLLHGAGKTVGVDTAGAPLRCAVRARPEILKPNRQELETLLGRRLRGRADIVTVLCRFAQRHEAVILTDGPAGAWFAASGRVLHGIPPAVAVVDTTGAGDALLGQFCAGYFPARVLTEAIAARAVAAGAATAAIRGTAALPVRRVAELARRVRITRAA